LKQILQRWFGIEVELEVQLAELELASDDSERAKEQDEARQNRRGIW
jgi:hypothetical protein